MRSWESGWNEVADKNLQNLMRSMGWQSFSGFWLAKEKESSHFNGRIRKLVWNNIGLRLCGRIQTFLIEWGVWKTKEIEGRKREREAKIGGWRIREIELNLLKWTEREIAGTRILLLTRNKLRKRSNSRMFF